MTTKPLEQQLAEYRANKKIEKQRKIDRAVTIADGTVTVLQLVVGTLLAVYAVHCVEYYQRPAAVRTAMEAKR